MKEYLIALSFIAVLLSCNPSSNGGSAKPIAQPRTQLDTLVEVSQPIPIAYKLQNAEQWLATHKADSLQLQIALAVNRTDYSNFSRMDSVVIPADLSYAKANYLPFPLQVDYLKDIRKIIFFSYPAQTFAAYENGKLIYTGPTNMGREAYATPTGLFFTNWKAKVAISTINSSWVLPWNFNILNKKGIGWHQYSLPGYPVSHSCLRLQAKDAEYLYNWADQWVLANSYTISVKGTPVIIFGTYDFSVTKPWLQLIDNPHALDISSTELEGITKPHLSEIMEAQKNSEIFLLSEQEIL